MLFELTKPGTLENVIIKAQHNCESDKSHYSGRFIPIIHEYLLLVRKDAALVYPIMLTYNQIADIRDMPGATWKDILADALEDTNDELDLSTIYELVGKYRRAQIQQFWKDKVRQTLQRYPNLFVNTRRGYWTMTKNVA